MSDLPRDPDADWALASAYVDGDVDADERAVVDANASLTSMVAQLRTVRARLAEPVEVPAAQRSAAIAAALTIQTDTTESDDRARNEVTTVAVLDAHPRRVRRMRWLGGAAAAAIIAVGVGVAVRDGSDSGDLQTASRAATTVANDGVLQNAAPIAGATDQAGGSPATTATRTASADAAPAGAAPATVAAVPTTSAGSSTEAAPTAPPTAAVPALDQPLQLLDLPSTVTFATPGTTPDPGPTTTAPASTTPASATTVGTCIGTGEVFLAIITYRGTAAVAVIDVQAHVRRARAVVGCSILAEVADPS